MNKIDKLKEQQKALAGKIKREQKREQEKRRARIYFLAAEVGIENLPDAIFKAAFSQIANQQKQQKTEVSHD